MLDVTGDASEETLGSRTQPGSEGLRKKPAAIALGTRPDSPLIT
jgi:hypothetical protein